MKEMICIVCPNGCKISIDESNLSVSGNMCKRGEDFAIKEITSPMRSLTTTVRTLSKDMPLLPVRTNGEIPKSKIQEAMRILNNVTIEKSVLCGEIVLSNILECDCDVIATSNLTI